MFKKEYDIYDKIQIIITFLLRLSLLIAIFIEIYNLKWGLLFVTGLIFLTTFLPYLFERRYRIMLPLEFEFVTVVFIYMALYLGEIKRFYLKFWWWDIVLHLGSGIALGFVGFIILFVLQNKRKISASPFWMSLFAFFFATGIGVLWEIFEFFMDFVFGVNMQKSGLVDTMSDLIVNSAGALCTSVVGYFYYKSRKGGLFGRLIKKFVKTNPKLFTKIVINKKSRN